MAPGIDLSVVNSCIGTQTTKKNLENILTAESGNCRSYNN